MTSSPFPSKRVAKTKLALGCLCRRFMRFLCCISGAYHNCTGGNNARKLFLICLKEVTIFSTDDSHKQTPQIFSVHKGSLESKRDREQKGGTDRIFLCCRHCISWIRCAEIHTTTSCCCSGAISRGAWRQFLLHA